MDNHKKLILEKDKFKYVVSITISMLFILLTIGIILVINFGKEESRYIAKEGILDLRDWKHENGEVIKLDGEWEFYSGKLIKSKEEFNEEIREYINVPGSWESYLKDEGLKNGSGTYRLIIKVPEDGVYGIKARTIRIANRIYLNGKEVANAGNPSINRNNLKAGSRYNIGVGSSLNKEIELIVQVTSLEYRSGGIIKSIEIGSVDSIFKESNRALALDALVVSVCLCLGLYFVLIYFQRNKDPYLAYFSMSNFFMGISLSTMNEQILTLIFDYEFVLRTRIQILAMIMVTIGFLRFIHYFFIDYSNKKVTKRITGIMVLTLLFVFNNPEKSQLISFGCIQAIIIFCMAISYGYIFYILIKAMYKKKDSLEYILVITISMFSYWVLLALKTFFEFDLGNIPVMLILLLMFSVSSLTSHRLQLDYQQANDLSEKLKRDDRLKDEFLVKSSHELRMPLEVIINSIKPLLEGKKGSLNISQQEDLLLIYQKAERVIRLTEDLRDASLIKKGKINLRLTSVDPYRAIQDVLEEIEILVPYSGDLILKNQIPEGFPPLNADADKFRQIIYDLIHNSIKYTKSGEIVISASYAEGQAEIQVKDTGKGIEEKYLKEVFDIFYQNNEEGEYSQGLGLGLSIVKHLVENQGGKIKVESTYGKGSIFIFTLPLYLKNENNNEFIIDTFAELSSTLEEEKLNNIGKSNILIIDDEISSQMALCNIINELNYNTITASSGKKALDILKTKKIDLIILDFMLSDMRASQLCNKIREEYSLVELPILILTASRKTIDLMSAFNYGVNDFQRKPIDSEELKSRIKSLLLIKVSAEEGLEREFQYFYSQISPHFLYNTLNSIIGLSYKDSEETRKALNNLSIYFRGKLDLHRKKGLVTLESELELVTAYLEIEEMRYGQRLEIEYDIEEGLKAFIPPLTLQPLAENSVYHGIANKDSGAKIKIIAKREPDGFISIIIEDNGKGMTFEKQQELLRTNNKGIGFRSVVERIKILKGAKLTLESKINEGTRISIVIPEVKYDESNFN